MKYTKPTILSLILTFAICFVYSTAWCQKNTSQAGNYQVKNLVDGYVTSYQNGYVILNDGTKLTGQISLFGNSYKNVSYVDIKTGGEKFSLQPRSLSEYGLLDNLVNDTPGKFNWRRLDKVKLGGDPSVAPKPSNTREGTTSNGYVVTKTGETIQGSIKIKEVRKKIVQLTVKGKDKKKYKFEPSELTNFGVGSPSDSNEDTSERESPEAVASSDNQEAGNDDSDEGYNPLDDSFLATKTTEESVQSNGYVITASGEKKEGAVSVTAPPKLWFATDVTLTSTDGVVTTYTNDGSLKKAVMTVNGIEKEFVNFENEYVEVLHRAGDLIHFRNPHPTTESDKGFLANAAAGAAAEALDENVRARARQASGTTYTGKEEGNIDYTKEQLLKLYAKEYLVLNEKTGKYAMYIPKKNYKQVDGLLKGSYEYLKMEKANRNEFKKMSNPQATLNFINNKILSK